MIENPDIFVRLFLSCVLGGIIGYERQARKKSAGLRTHILVSLGSCLIMVLSMNIYAGVQGLTNADPARLAAQVISGIGFLGAGTIMKEGLTVTGLTTAASLWLVAAIGLAAGSGHYFSALCTTGLGFIILLGLPKIEKIYAPPGSLAVTVITLDRPGQIGRIGSYLGSICVSIRDIKIEDCTDKKIAIGLSLQMSGRHCAGDIMTGLMNLDGVVAVKCD